MRSYSLPFDGIVHAVAGPSDYPAFLDWLGRRRPYLGLDAETAGLDRGQVVRLVQLGDAREAWVVQADRDRAVIRDALGRGRFVAWNAAFDVDRLAAWLGIDYGDLLGRTSDTQVLAGLLDPRAGYQGGTGHKLKEWAVSLLGDDADAPARDLDELFRAEGWGSAGSKKCRGWAEVPLTHPTYLRYSGADPILTVRVHEHLAEQMRPRAVAVRREQTVMRIAATIEHHGFALDEEHTEAVRVHYAEQTTATAAELTDLGITKAGSTKQVADRLRDEGLEDLIALTEKGNESVDKRVLTKADRLGSAAADLVLRHKRAKHYGRDYAEKYQAAAALDGRVHPGLRSIGTKTRRMTSSAPNIQQVPKEKPSPVVLRGCFVAEPGHVLVAADFVTMELRYVAWLASDSKLLAAIEASDMFVALAEQVWPGHGAEHRQDAKIAVYAIIYGCGARTLANILGLPERDCRRLRDTFWRTYPVLHAAFDRAARKVESMGGVELPLSGWLPSDKHKSYVGLNLMVQGGCRDAFGERLVEMGDAGLTPYLRALIHDEAVWSVPRDEVEDVTRVIRRLMPIGLEGGQRIGVDVKAGPSWGHMTKVEVEHERQ